MFPTEAQDPLRSIDPLNSEWVTLLLLGVVVTLAITNMSSPRKWQLLTRSLFTIRLGRQTLREEIDLQDRSLSGLILMAIAVLSLFLWQAGTVLIPTEVPSFAWLAAAVGLSLIAHGLLLRSLTTVVDTSKGISEYFATGLLLFILAGLALLPIVTLLAYGPAWRASLLSVGAIICLLLLIYRWIRGAWMGLSEGIPARYLILYLCAAEAAPVLLIAHAWYPSLLATSTP